MQRLLTISHSSLPWRLTLSQRRGTKRKHFSPQNKPENLKKAKKEDGKNVSIFFLMEVVDTLDSPPTREPDLGHKKNPYSPAYCVLLANYSPISSGCFNSFDFGLNNLSNRVLFRCFASLSNLS